MIGDSRREVPIPLQSGIGPGATVEIRLNGTWVGGYEVRRLYRSFVSVIDKAEGFFSSLIDVANADVRHPEIEDPLWRDAEGNIFRRATATSGDAFTEATSPQNSTPRSKFRDPGSNQKTPAKFEHPTQKRHTPPQIWAPHPKFD